MDLISSEPDARSSPNLPPAPVKRVRIQLDKPDGDDEVMDEQQANTTRASPAKVPILIDLSVCSPPNSPRGDEPQEEFVTPREEPLTPVGVSPVAPATSLPGNPDPRSPRGEADQQLKTGRPERSKEELRQFKKEKNLRKRARRHERKKRASMGLDLVENNVDQPAQPQVLPSTPQKKTATPKRNSWSPLSKDPREWDVDF